MKKLSDYINRYPDRSKSLLAIDYEQLTGLIAQLQQAETQQLARQQAQKTRINAPGAGRPSRLTKNVTLFRTQQVIFEEQQEFAGDKAYQGAARTRSVPIGIAIEGANRHDMKLTERTLESQRIVPDKEDIDLLFNLCLDKGYDYQEVKDILQRWGYVGHISPRNERERIIHNIENYKARRCSWCSSD